MRILYISDVYFPRVNGVSTSIRTFRRELQAIGHEVVVVAPEYSQSAPADEAGIVRVPARGVPLDPEDRLMHSRSLRELSERLGPRAFDLVHIQTPFAAHYAGLRIARELGVPCVATYHTFFEEYLYHYVPFAPRALMRALARSFSRRQGNQVDALGGALACDVVGACRLWRALAYDDFADRTFAGRICRRRRGIIPSRARHPP